jgi:hypothetical protein
MKKKICKWYQLCPMKKFYEEGKLDKRWIENYCFKNGRNCKRLERANKGLIAPDNMLPNGEIDKTLNSINIE